MTAPRRSEPTAPPRDEEDDDALVARAIAGHRDAFRALYRRHRPAVHRLARAFATLDPDDAEDVVQEAFIRAFEAIAKLADRTRFGPWILAIARNRALSRLGGRRASERLAADLRDDVDALARAVVELPELDAGTELELVRKIVAELPEGPEKETVRLFYVEGELSAREIAARLGVGKSAITMRLERFRAKVKRRILAAVARQRGEGS